MPRRTATSAPMPLAQKPSILRSSSAFAAVTAQFTPPPRAPDLHFAVGPLLPEEAKLRGRNRRKIGVGNHGGYGEFHGSAFRSLPGRCVGWAKAHIVIVPTCTVSHAPLPTRSSLPT